MIDEGTKLGPYEVKDLLGAGGMGEVYRAFDERLGRDVAVKVLAPHLTARSDVLDRFEREAKVVAALSHPNIVAIYDVGKTDDYRYVVTELLKGKTLREQIAEEGLLDWRESVELALAVARGLAAAHELGITHRDIKPENIFVTSHGPKILDFGLARLDQSMAELDNQDKTAIRTPAGFVMGTVGYMSPEQAAGEDAGPPSDIFSLGCVMYELFSGKRPFQRKTAAETLHAILMEPPSPLDMVDPSVQSELESILMKTFEKSPEKRFCDGSEILDALEALLSGDRQRLSEQIPLAQRVGRRNLAVLTFEAPGDDEELEEAALFLTEELQNRLANDTELQLVARSRVNRLGAQPEPEEAAKSLGASLVIAGSVRRSSSGVSVRVELVDAESGVQMWGDRKRLPGTSDQQIFSLINSMLDSLEPHLPFRNVAQLETVVTRPEISEESAEILGVVNSDLSRGEISGFRRAIELLERSVEGGTNFGLGYAKLAETRLTEALNGFVPTEKIREKAIDEAETAVATAASPETTITRARIRSFLEWEWRSALESLEPVGESSEALLARAEILVCLGNRADAIEAARRAPGLEHLNPSVGERAARVMYYGRRWIDAQEQAHKTLIQRDSSVNARIVLALSLARQGMFEPAQEELQSLTRKMSDYPEADVALAEHYALWEKKAGARKILRRLDNPPRPRYSPLTMRARIESVMGDREKALDRLEEALEKHEVHLGFLRCDPAWDPIRSEQRFLEIETQIFES